MNIQQQAFKLFLENRLPENCTKYFSGDYPQIIDKVNIFKKKNGETPSLDFLMNYSSKLGENSEQAERISDLLYGVSKLKDDSMSVKEVCELLLDSYKDGKLRELIKKSSQALVDDNIVLVERYSKEISEISRLSLGEDNFLKNDDKKAFSQVSAKLSKISSGLLLGEDTPISKNVVGSNIVYSAASGIGKTILGITTCLNCFLEGQNVLMISYEISKSQIFLRMKSIMTGVPLNEISDNVFLTEEARIRVLCSGYVMTKQIKLEEAIKLYNSKGEEAFAELPDRTNSIKILAALGQEELKVAKENGVVPDSLPNDIEILEILKTYGLELDSVIIDYISEVPFSSNFNNREINITEFTRQLKLLALELGFNNYILSQVSQENDAYGIFQPKYALSLLNVADTAIFMVATKEMKQLGLVALCVRKARHYKTNVCYICNIDYETQTLTYTNETCTLSELQDALKKDFKQSEKK